MEWKARTLSYGRGWTGRGERRDTDLKPKVRGQAQPGGRDDLLPQAEGLTRGVGELPSGGGRQLW